MASSDSDDIIMTGMREFGPIVLNIEESEAFLAMLNASPPKEPTPAMKRAVEMHREWIRGMAEKEKHENKSNS